MLLITWENQRKRVIWKQHKEMIERIKKAIKKLNKVIFNTIMLSTVLFFILTQYIVETRKLVQYYQLRYSFFFGPQQFLLQEVILFFFFSFVKVLGFPDSSAGKESACNAGDPGSIPGLGRSAGEGVGYSLQFSWASLVAQLVKNLPSMKQTWVRSLGW